MDLRDATLSLSRTSCLSYVLADFPPLLKPMQITRDVKGGVVAKAPARLAVYYQFSFRYNISLMGATATKSDERELHPIFASLPFDD